MKDDIREFIRKQRVLGQAQLSEFDPSDADHQEHLKRYMFAAKYLKPPCRVLDVACGIGYGSRHLADSANGANVTGLDLSEQAVRYGASNFQNESVRFMVGDCTCLPFSSNTFDYVTSFETVEHIPEYERFLSEILRVLKPGGTLVMSTPNREFTNPTGSLKSRPPSTHHIREWRISEFRPLLERFFESIQWFSQLSVRMPLAEKAFIISRRPLATLVPALRNAWIWWHRKEARGAGSTSEGLEALNVRFRIDPWDDSHPGRIIVTICRKAGVN